MAPTKQEQQLRIALVGAGKMGLQHARAIRTYGKLDLVACVDINRDALSAVESATGLNPVGYTSLVQMLAAEQPDVVVVATTTMHHYEPTLTALRGGSHVVCEKPMAWSLKQADMMIDAATESDRALLVNNEYNVHPRTRAVLDAVEQGLIGDIVGLRGTFKGNFVGGFDLAEGAPHVFSLAAQFCGIPKRVAAHFATGDKRSTKADIFDGRILPTLDGGWLVGDRVHTMVEFDHGIVMHVELLGTKTTPALVLLGTKGALFLPYGATERGPLLGTDPNDPLTTWKPLDVSYPSFAPNDPVIDKDPDHVYTELNLRSNAIAYENWSSWLLGGRIGEHPMSGQQGRRALEIVHASYQSHFDHSGDWVDLPLRDRGHALENRVRPTA